jgi:hypothetical protein
VRLTDLLQHHSQTRRWSSLPPEWSTTNGHWGENGNAGVRGKIYWADRFGGDIWRAETDGSGQTRLLGGLSAPEVVALDIASGKIYWGDLIDRQILRANLDGTGKEIVVPVMPNLSPRAGPVGIALDVAGGKIYWTDVDLSGPNGDVRRANLDDCGTRPVG